jgi:methyl-accepting chemotaxis protein
MYGKKSNQENNIMNLILRRRNFLVNKDLQFSLLCITLGYVVFFLLVMSASLFVPLMVNLKAEGGEISKQSLESANNLIFLHNNFWLPSLLCMISISIHSIRTSHRIAGPIYRLNTVVESIKQGILPPPLPGLRKGDYLAEEFSQASDMLENLRLKLGDIQAKHEDLDKTISQCNELSDKSSQEEVMQSINEIRAKSSQLGEKIGYFSILNNESPCEHSNDKTHTCGGNCTCVNQTDGTSESDC